MYIRAQLAVKTIETSTTCAQLSEPELVRLQQLVDGHGQLAPIEWSGCPVLSSLSVLTQLRTPPAWIQGDGNAMATSRVRAARPDAFTGKAELIVL